MRLFYPRSEDDDNPEKGINTLLKLIDKRVSLICEDNDMRQPLLWAASSGMP